MEKTTLYHHGNRWGRRSHDRRKSVIAHPEDCQSCGQCYFNCPGHSLGFSDMVYSAAMTAVR